MTTVAEQDLHHRLREIGDCERSAWLDYRESLRDLAGSDYESAEDASWERLQDQLRELADERAQLDAELARRRD